MAEKNEKVNEKVNELVAAVNEVEQSGREVEPQLVSLRHIDPKAVLYYTLDGTYPIPNKSLVYDKPFYVYENTTLKCVALVGNDVSPVATKHYIVK